MACYFTLFKVRMMAIQLEDMNMKLKNATQEEQKLLASLASLKAELKNANNEVQNMKKEAEDTSIEMEEHVNHLQIDLDAAISRETKTKNCLSNLNEALQQVYDFASWP
jgi:chromosome segregation ATPase